MEHRIDFRDQIAKNKWKSYFLLTIMFLVLVLFGYVISFAFDPGYFFIIMVISIVFSLSYILFSYYNSSRIAIASVKAKKLSHVRSGSDSQAKARYNQYESLVEALTIASGIPMPKLYVMHSPQINAFASGRNPENAVICVTTGILEKLDKKELEGVLAHELGHIANFDIRYMTLATVMVGMIAIISEMFLYSLWFRGGNNKNIVFILIGIAMAILAPIAVKLIQFAISRKRELNADASAIKFTRYPQGLIGALTKIQKENYPEKKISKALAPLFFSNPLNNLAKTHPPIEKRIKILQRM